MLRALFCVALLASLTGAAARAADEPAASVGVGVGTVTPSTESDCAPLILHSDGGDENAVTWKAAGQAAPYWGAFAERFAGPLDVCALVFDLTQVGNYSDQLADVYIWNDHLGQPGSVRYMELGVALGPVGFWPSISRHTVAVAGDNFQSGVFWAGIWGEWPGATNGWFIAVDQTAPIGAAPMTNIIGGIGYDPAGWQPVSLVWEDSYALGIGIRARTIDTSGVPDSPIRVGRGSWGRVKSLYN